MTGHLKSLIRLRQKAYKQNNHFLFKFYRNRVNRERKLCKSNYYQAKVNDLNGIDSRKWWSQCRRLCGMQKFSGDLAAKLLYGMPPTKINIISLANDINNSFLEPQQVFEPLQASYRLVTTGYQVPTLSPEVVARVLITVKVEDIKKDLRPISLTPTLSKIAEHFVVQDHVKPAILRKLRSDQFGCIPGSSTTHALITMIHNRAKETDGLSNDVRVFVLDYKKAFDLIDHSLLMIKLPDYDINPYIINWIGDFLSNRFQRVKLAKDCFSEWQSVPAGVPQGTKLGPWLFIAMIDDLVVPSANGTVKDVDATTVDEVVDSREVSQAQNSINEITQWPEINKFQLHPKKCKELRISFSRSPAIRELVLINETAIIDLVKSVKVLGVIIQDNLKWNQHVDATVTKAAKRLYFLIQLKRAHVPAKDLVCFYIACIQSVLLYACQVFHYSLPEYLSSAVERVQKRAMRIIYGYAMCLTLMLLRPQYKRFLPTPLCKTNRFSNTFINASARIYDSK